jgi:hypothetical protein
MGSSSAGVTWAVDEPVVWPADAAVIAVRAGGERHR